MGRCSTGGEGWGGPFGKKDQFGESVELGKFGFKSPLGSIQCGLPDVHKLHRLLCLVLHL